MEHPQSFYNFGITLHPPQTFILGGLSGTFGHYHGARTFGQIHGITEKTVIPNQQQERLLADITRQRSSYCMALLMCFQSHKKSMMIVFLIISVFRAMYGMYMT